MKIFVRCTDCQKSLSVDAENEGKKARCPNCGSVFEIRTQSTATGTEFPGAHVDARAPVTDAFVGGGQPAVKMSPVKQGELQISGGTRDDVAGWVSIALGTISILMGILGIVFTLVCCCFPFGIIGAGIGISAIVTAVFAKSPPLKIVGILLGTIGLVISIAPLIVGIVGIAAGGI